MNEVVRVSLPDLYRALTGNTKKRFAWSYLQKYHPYYEPLSDQPDLEDRNQLLCIYNVEKARQITKETVERREEKARLKKKGRAKK